MLIAIILIAALVCFLLAAFNVATARIQLVPLGLALWVLTLILSNVVLVPK